MSHLTKVVKGIRKPPIAFRAMNRYFHRNIYSKVHKPKSFDFLEADWDNAIILDACRYDMFERNVSIDGELTAIQSSGTSTIEFLTENFHGQDIHDTIYVTGNPQLYRNKEKINVQFHSILDVWDDEGWDDKFGTVLPETMTEYALNAEEKYPNKRMIVHYIQPHYPFIGSNTSFDKGHLEKEGGGESTFWKKLLAGDLNIPKEDIWSAYTDNLHRVIPSVTELASKLNGKTVITSDHGNLVGERVWPIPIEEWGHPPETYVNNLTRVPWLELEFDSRKNITTEEPEEYSTESKKVSERLKQLGYMD